MKLAFSMSNARTPRQKPNAEMGVVFAVSTRFPSRKRMAPSSARVIEKEEEEERRLDVNRM
jgi:hypothetical protein